MPSSARPGGALTSFIIRSKWESPGGGSFTSRVVITSGKTPSTKVGAGPSRADSPPTSRGKHSLTRGCPQISQHESSRGKLPRGGCLTENVVITSGSTPSTQMGTGPTRCDSPPPPRAKHSLTRGCPQTIIIESTLHKSSRNHHHEFTLHPRIHAAHIVIIESTVHTSSSSSSSPEVPQEE